MASEESNPFADDDDSNPFCPKVESTGSNGSRPSSASSPGSPSSPGFGGLSSGDLFGQQIPSRDVEIFECQRFQPRPGPVENRWSCDYLLPTDKRRYRVRGAKDSYNTLKEVDAAMLPMGWSWAKEQWHPDPLPMNVDADGWSYGAQWNPNYEAGNPQPGKVGLVRWRRTVRKQTWSGGSAFLIACGANKDLEGCQNVDLEAATKISKQLLDTLSAASMKGELSFLSVMKLKQQLVEKVMATPPQQSFNRLETFLEQFVQSQGPAARLQVFKKTQGKKDDKEEEEPKEHKKGGALSFIGRGRNNKEGEGETFVGDDHDQKKGDQDQTLAGRIEEMEPLFPKLEQEVMAAFVMRRFAPKWVCDHKNQTEDHECKFREVYCTNVGCSERFSWRQKKSHDFQCLFKRVKCQQCEEMILRKEMTSHLAAACPKRVATCMFARIGCDAKLTQQSLGHHLETCTTSHLMLLMAKIDEQQELIEDLAREITTDKENFAKARDTDRKQLGELAIQVGTLRNKVERNGDVGHSLNNMQTEIKRLETQLNRLQH